MIALLLTPFGKFLAAIVGLLALGAVIFGWYEVKISEAKKEALASFNQQQLEQAIADKNKYIAEMQTLQQDERNLENQNEQLNNQLQTQQTAIDSFINASKDTLLDPLFNQLLVQLRGKMK
jgi:uncharacterized protein HemX